MLHTAIRYVKFTRNVAAEWLAISLRIRQASCSNLVPDTGHNKSVVCFNGPFGNDEIVHAA